MDTTNTLGRSWSYMCIIDDQPHSHHRLIILFWAVLDVFHLWRQKYCRKEEASR
ncbi:MAG TPA: hypothetical protein VF708_19810 [Pyrinomonadaceae bacterium]|jgi:hypothetical protein